MVNNFRPGVTERLGLGYEESSALNPRLIYALGTGFGTTGPYVDKGGQDMLAQAYSGSMSHLVDPDDKPRVYPVSLADYATGMHMVQAILLAVIARDRTGHGQRIEVALYDAMLAMQVLEAAVLLNRGTELNWAALPLNGTFPTLDGAIVLVGCLQGGPPPRHLRRARLGRTAPRPGAPDQRWAGSPSGSAPVRVPRTFRERHDSALARPPRAGGPGGFQSTSQHGRWSEECSHAVGGTVPAEDLPGTSVQLGLHERDVTVGVDGQVGGLGEVGAQ